jgi:hypothetical protein
VSIPDYGIIYNWDGNPLSYSEYPQSVGQLLEKVYAPIRDTQVGAHFWCVGEQEAKWPSQDLPITGDAVGRVYETVWNMRMAESIRAMFERGEDPYGDIVRHGHDLGVDVWASVRMNDNHFWAVSSSDGEVTHRGKDPMWWWASRRKPLSVDEMTRTTASYLTQERKDHPQWTLGDTADPWAATSWNMAIPEVRELRLKLISEALRQADWDGVELDWQRHGFHLPTTDGFRLRYVLTDLQRAVRRLADEMARARRRPFHVAVRVASTLESCRRIGYDIETWVNEGLCDLIIPGGNSGTDADIDMDGFREILAGTQVKLYAGLDTDFRMRAKRLMPQAEWSDRWIRGEAAKLWDQGADGMYAFNWHANAETKRGLLTTVGSPETLAGSSKVYAAVHGSHAAQGTLRHGADRHDRIYAETPVTLYPTLTDECPVFHLPFHDDLAGAIHPVIHPGTHPDIELQIEIEHFSPTIDRVEVNVNGMDLGLPAVRNAAAEDPADPAMVSENSWLVWPLDPAQLSIGVQEVRVRLVERDERLSVALVIRHVEVHVAYSTDRLTA